MASEVRLLPLAMKFSKDTPLVRPLGADISPGPSCAPLALQNCLQEFSPRIAVLPQWPRRRSSEATP